ncbi:MAG: fibronectin type III domain-containing protein [Eubacteriales bacterium]|nr:fibronectin type III domain-containing protein [Eubacteriales bacterium]
MDAFYGCTGLTKVNLPSKMTSISYNSFAQCKSLKTISIPASVTNISSYAISGCSAITDVYYNGSKKEWEKIDIADNNICLTTANIHYNSSMPLDKPMLNSPTLLTNSVKLSWNSVSGATKYRVFYRLAGAGSWTKLADTTGNSYQVKGLQSGKTYEFSVRCVKADGSSYTSDMSTAKKIRYVAAPVIRKLNLGTTGVNVQWGSVSGAAKYRVYYRVSGTSTWKKAGDTTSTSYFVNKLNSGKTYDFTVRCVSSDGTAFTSASINSGNSLRYVKAPVVSSVKNVTSGVAVRWKQSPGASKYRVYYKASGSNSWTIAGETTANSFLVKGLKSGKNYTFTVRCRNKAGTSYTSSYTSGKSLLYLATPKVNASSASRGVKVSWNKISGAAGYHVYRKTADGYWTKIKTIRSGSTVSYTDRSASSGKRYYYTVRAYQGGVLGAYVTSGASAVAR